MKFRNSATRRSRESSSRESPRGMRIDRQARRTYVQKDECSIRFQGGKNRSTDRVAEVLFSLSLADLQRDFESNAIAPT